MDLSLGASNMLLLPDTYTIWKGSNWMVVRCPSHSVFCLLLRILTVVSITVMLWVRVLEFCYIRGECGEGAVCKSTTVSNTSQNPFINAVVRPFSGTEFWGYQILHLHSVTMTAVGLVLKHSLFLCYRYLLYQIVSGQAVLYTILCDKQN